VSTNISSKIRQEVVIRANGCCEYCLFPEEFRLYTFEIDHILSRKHDGETTLANLALACFDCNRRKGTDIASYDDLTGNLTAFFNPRTQIWTEHFQMQNGEIIALSPEARVVVNILQLNSEERIEQRQILVELGMY
jgi:HNH endonuclease